ncbi:type 4a pilus biogenesis protein PilO [soil metagenome]
MADLKNIGNSIGSQFRGLNGLHPGQWPVVPRMMCGVGVLAAVIALGWGLYWNPQLDELEAGQKEEVKLKDEYRTKVQQAVNLDGLRKQKDQIKDYVSTLEKQLPSKAEMDALLSDINQSGLGRGLQFELFKPGSPLVKDYYAEQPIEIKVTGNYHDVGAFASDIANLPRIVTLNNLNLVAVKEGGLALNAVAKTFRYLDQEEVNAQRKATAKTPGATPAADDGKGAKK